MFLIDTNCWIQLARNRMHAVEVTSLLAGVPVQRLFVTVYSVHSIGNALTRRGWGGYAVLLNDLSIGRDIQLVSIPVEQLGLVEQAWRSHGLDFDDAYQYVAAELHGLKLVSLDADFDRTPNGRLTPEAALALYKNEQTNPTNPTNP